jgi:hypothetical protein
MTGAPVHVQWVLAARTDVARHLSLSFLWLIFFLSDAGPLQVLANAANVSRAFASGKVSTEPFTVNGADI